MATRRYIGQDLEAMTITIIEYTGKRGDDTYDELERETFCFNDLNEEMQQQCKLHGMTQKLNDSTAGKNDEKGFTVADRFGLVRDLWAQLVEGFWKKPSSGKSAGKIAPNAVIVAARAAGMPEEQIAILERALKIKKPVVVPVEDEPDVFVD